MVTNLMVESQNQFCGNITTSNECDTTFTVKIDPSLPVKRKTRFHDLCLPHEILRAIDDLDFQYCTPIQEAILSQVIDGVDAACQSQTGTGKSAAFLISILTRLSRQDTSVKRQPGSPRALILAPTRELVSQIEKDALDLAQHSSLVIASAISSAIHTDVLKENSPSSHFPLMVFSSKCIVIPMALLCRGSDACSSMPWFRCLSIACSRLIEINIMRLGVAIS